MDAITTPVPLVDRLTQCAALWAETPDGSLSKLGKIVVRDGAFFDRLGERGPSTSTLEKFARFLADPANWPDGAVPEGAVSFAHVTGVTPATPPPSPGKST